MGKCARAFLRPLGTAGAAVALTFAAGQAGGAERLRSETPVPAVARPDGAWMKRHAAKVEEAKAGGSAVVLLGDGQVRGFESRGVQVWRKYFQDEPYRAMNLGFDGDCTENLIWRIDNGELDGFKAKAIVLEIGTNNTGRRSRAEESPIDTLLGIWAAIERIRAKQPTARIILCAIPPRGADADDPLRLRNDEVNRMIRTLANGRDLVWCDFNDLLTTEKGALPFEICRDGLHLENFAYELWANAVLPQINDALDRKTDRLAPSRYSSARGRDCPLAGRCVETLPFMDRIGYRGAGSPQDWYVRKLQADRREIAAAEGTFDVVFVGDSITHGWNGKPALARLRKDYRILNLGYSGDGTQHVLWRLANGQLEGYKSKLFMLMIGTNNGGTQETVDGVKAILALIRARHPESKVLLLPIFPIAASPKDARRVRREAVSKRLHDELADGKTVLWHDFNARLLEPDGTYSRAMSADLLHPGARGYDIWASEIEPIFKTVCGQGK